MSELNNLLEEIAKKKLDISTLESRGAEFDFYIMEVSRLKDALRTAFEFGMEIGIRINT